MVYNSTFPATPPADPNSSASVAQHDQLAFASIDTMLRHWDRPHRRSYHWLLSLGAHAPLIALSQRCQELLPTSGLDLIPPDGLHLTVNRLGYVDDTSPARLQAALHAARQNCASTPAFHLGVIPLAGSPGAIRFSVAPWSPLLDLHRITARVAGQGSGDPLVTYRPHIGIAYSNRIQDPAPFVEAVLHAQSFSPIEITVDEIRLVELYRAERHYRWTTVEQLPLTGP